MFLAQCYHWEDDDVADSDDSDDDGDDNGDDCQSWCWKSTHFGVKLTKVQNPILSFPSCGIFVMVTHPFLSFIYSSLKWRWY